MSPRRIRGGTGKKEGSGAGVAGGEGPFLLVIK